MLWYTGSGLLALWFVLAFLLHKHGAVHILLFLAISFYMIQLAQDRRTKEYKDKRLEARD
jgi:1,4-dihydroxy-2-naphthoate octaprenyltransferase